MLSTLQTLFDWIFTRGGCYPHFTDGSWSSQQLSSLPLATEFPWQNPGMSYTKATALSYCTVAHTFNSQCNGRTSSISITWALVKNAEFQAPPQTYEVRICISTNPQESRACSSLTIPGLTTLCQQVLPLPGRGLNLPLFFSRWCLLLQRMNPANSCDPPAMTLLKFPTVFKILTWCLFDSYESVFRCLIKHLCSNYDLKLGLFLLQEAKKERKLIVLNNWDVQAMG